MNRAEPGVRAATVTIDMSVPYASRAVQEMALIRRRPPPFQGRGLADKSRRKMLLIVIAVIASVVVGMWWLQMSPKYLIGAEFGMILSLVLVAVVVRSFWLPWGQREAALSPINQTPMRIRLDANGVRATNDVLDQTVLWQGLLGVTESKKAIALWFGRGSLLVLPDDCLPPGLSHDAAMRAITDWREAA